MRFYTFSSQAERREMGGSYFIELQYAALPPEAGLPALVSPDAYAHWRDDSLYVYGDDDNAFYTWYGGIFTGGVYANGRRGPVDLVGVNYYGPDLAERICSEVRETPLPDSETLLRWLESPRAARGFYVLGL